MLLYEGGQPRWCQSGWLPVPRSISRIWMSCDFLTRCYHTPTNKRKARLFVFVFFSPRDITELSEKHKCNHNWSAKIKSKKTGFTFVFQLQGTKSDRNSQNCVGHRSNVTCSRHCLNTCFMYRNRSLATPPDGRIGQRNWYRSSSWLHNCLHQLSPWSGTMIFGAVIGILCQNVGKSVHTF